MTERCIEPTPERLQSFLAEAKADEPIVMINLLRYREHADYAGLDALAGPLPDGLDTSACSGREAYGRYGQVAMATIAKAGGRILWAGAVSSALIAASDEDWDDAVLVEYPSPQAFVGMVTSPEYLAGAPHRTAALLDSRLVASRGLMGPLGS